ncbi:MAG: hypothetical protein V8R80_07735 [Eubacterium sp.]
MLWRGLECDIRNPGKQKRRQKHKPDYLRLSQAERERKEKMNGQEK